MSERNLDVSIDVLGTPEAPEKVARVCVVKACGYTRDGGAPTISINCPDYRIFEAEVRRLKDELDAAVVRVREEWTGQHESKPALQEGAGVAAAALATEMHGSLAELTVADVMTRDPKTLHRNDKVVLADELMNVGDFRHVVVLDDDEHVAGILSRQDIFYGALAWTMGFGKASYDSALRTSPAKAVMQTAVKTVSPDTPLAEAASIMIERKIGCLPVVDGPKLVGILTEGDLLALLARAYGAGDAPA